MVYRDEFEEHDEAIIRLENPGIENYYFYEEQAAEILKIDRVAIRKLIKSGALDGIGWLKEFNISGRKRYMIGQTEVVEYGKFFSMREAAEVLGCCVSTVGRRVESGDLEAFFYRCWTLVYKDSVYAFDELLGDRRRNGRRRFPRFRSRKKVL